jgi:hypothetical protein
MIVIAVFAFVAFHPGYGFQNNFNKLYDSLVANKDEISLTSSQQHQRSDTYLAGP